MCKSLGFIHLKCQCSFRIEYTRCSFAAIHDASTVFVCICAKGFNTLENVVSAFKVGV